MMGYGGFPGGDPREFHPDPECSTDAEREAHAKDCAAWDEWQQGGCVGDPPKPSVRYGHGPLGDGSDAGYVTYAGYGLGTYSYDDDNDFEIECDSSPSCQCDACSDERHTAEEAALARHREATRTNR